MLHWLLVFLLSLALVGCQPTEPETQPAETAVETEAPLPQPLLFSDFFEARRALYRLEDIDLPLKYYTPESFEVFRETRDSVTAAMQKIPSDGGDEAHAAVE